MLKDLESGKIKLDKKDMVYGNKFQGQICKIKEEKIEVYVNFDKNGKAGEGKKKHFFIADLRKTNFFHNPVTGVNNYYVDDDKILGD